MFDYTKLDGRLNAITYFVSLLISLVVHIVVLSVVLVLPLIFFNALNTNELLTFLVDPPAPPAPPALPSPPVRPSSRGERFIARQDVDIAPAHIPDGILPPDDSQAAIGIEDLLADTGQVSGQAKGMEGMLDALLQRDPPKLTDPPRPKKPTLIRVGGVVQQSKRIFMVDPVYPDLARRARVSGTVILEATIDEEGNVSELRILSGHPLLNQAAVEAVKQWKYSPTVLNGEPMMVQAVVTVIFHLRER
jgi:protein TonB